MKLVSVILPTYKQFSYIYQCIDSVLCQDYQQLELIVTDDGSDHFPKIEIENYIKKNMRNNLISFLVIHHQENVGTVRNLNHAIRQSKGHYIMNLAGDDCFYNNQIISKIVACMEKNNYTNLVCRRKLMGKENRFLPTDEDLAKIEKMNTPLKQFRSLVLCEFYNFASGSAFYYTRSFFDMYNGYDENFRLWEDGPKLMQSTYKGHLINTNYDIISILYREGGVSNTTNTPPALQEDTNYLYSTISKECAHLFSGKYRRKFNFIVMKKSKWNTLSKSQKIVQIILYFDIFIKRKLAFYYKKTSRK